MKILVDWMERRVNSSSNRDGLAIDAMREATDVWPGVGVYTSDELFYIAGVYYVLCSLILIADHPYYPRNSSFCHRRRSLWPTKAFTGSTCLLGIIWMGARNPRYLVMYFSDIIYNWSWLMNLSMLSTQETCQASLSGWHFCTYGATTWGLYMVASCLCKGLLQDAAENVRIKKWLQCKSSITSFAQVFEVNLPTYTYYTG